MTLSNLYLIDNNDLFTTYGIWVESGSDDFLKIPEVKERLSHTWLDEDGDDIDLSHTYFSSRTINLSLASMYSSKADFWNKYSSFIALLRSPGARKLTIARHGKDYYVCFKNSNSIKSYNLKVQDAPVILFRFSLTLLEPKPIFT